MTRSRKLSLPTICLLLLSLMGCAMQTEPMPGEADATGVDTDSSAAVAASEQALATSSGNDAADPTAWKWYHGVTPATLSTQVANGYRIVDLEVEQESPLRLSAALVRNTGDHKKTWWWYYGQTSQQVKDRLSQNGARLVDLQVYRVNGQKRYAVVMIKNAGDDAASWWYYTDATFNYLMDKVSDNSARLIDIDSYEVNGVRRYSGIMVRNTGSHARSWWVYANVSAATVSQKLSEHRARLVDIERQGSNFTVIMERRSGPGWWWYHGLTSAQLKDRYDQNGARIADIEPYMTNSGKRFDVIMVSNVNALTASIRAQISSGTTGNPEYGFLLREVDGPTLASLRPEHRYYSASSIKTLQAARAMDWVENQGGSLATQLNVYAGNGSNTCSDVGAVTQESMGTAIRRMLVNSNNSSTNAVQVFFSANGITNYGRNTVGMSNDTLIGGRFGCGGPNASTVTTTDLDDITTLYEDLSQGALLSPGNVQWLHDNMLNESNGLIRNLVIAERNNLGLTGAEFAEFDADHEGMYKGGSWSIDGVTRWNTMGGYVRLPHRLSCSRVENKDYVFGMFVSNADTIGSDAGATGVSQAMLRQVVRDALQTYKGACTPDRIGTIGTISF